MEIVSVAGLPKSTVTFDRIWAIDLCCPKYTINKRVTIAKQIGSSLLRDWNLNVNCIFLIFLMFCGTGRRASS